MANNPEVVLRFRDGKTQRGTYDIVLARGL